MPELPDLEAMKSFLNRRLPGLVIEEAQALIPVVIRLPRADFESLLQGNAFAETQRRGKFLLFSLKSGHVMVLNPMLTGRLQYSSPDEKKRRRTCIVLGLSNGCELRYVDERLMGKVYVVPADNLDAVPQFAEMGPDALSPELTEEAFEQRLRRYSGQIKNVLLNQRFIAGIGNAYADEILFAAGIHPFRKRSTLTSDETLRLHQSIRSVLEEAAKIVEERTREHLPLEEVRDFLKVHRRGGEACPNCGGRISEITAGNRVTSFCRRCQK
jgi:formamidopyrimidine-DNA glycosylase